MAKKKKVIAEPVVNAPDDLVEGIVNDVRFDKADAIVVIAIPSHDFQSRALEQGKQSRYATAAMQKFADLFGGATALRSYKGIYRADSGKHIWDDTILIQAFCDPTKLNDIETIRSVVQFARSMCKQLDQEAVMVVFNNVMRFVRKDA
jgi:hypothetical protein